MNRLGVMRPSAYVLAGLPLWVALLKGGVHPTIAGVIVGLSVPARPRYSRAQAIEEARALVHLADDPDEEDTDRALQSLEHRLGNTQSPLAKLEHALHAPVAFVIVPLFALANAGVSLQGLTFADAASPASLGVLVGLFVGKQVGIMLATWLAVRTRVGELPEKVRWLHVYGMSVLAGIGFTMSLFIAGLAYGEGTTLHTQAKLGILAASTLAAILGLAVLSRGGRPATGGTPG